MASLAPLRLLGACALAGLLLVSCGEARKAPGEQLGRRESPLSAQTWTQQRELSPAIGQPNERFGWAVALGADMAVVGAPSGGVAGRLFRYPLTTLDEEHFEPADGEAGDGFGSAVSLSGTTVVVGAPGDDSDAGADAGSVYLIPRADPIWTIPSVPTYVGQGAGERLGYSVALGSDSEVVQGIGNPRETAVVGAPFADTGAPNAGSVYVFTRGAEAWSGPIELVAPTPVADESFGWSVSISGDDLLVGAQGAAFAVRRTGSVWSKPAALPPPDVPYGPLFGEAVAVSGNWALVGSPLDVDAAGLVHVYSRITGAWKYERFLAAADAWPEDAFGTSLALDGDRAVIGSPYFHSTGGAFVFVRNEDGWSEGEELARPVEAEGSFGNAVAIQGPVAFVGAWSAGPPSETGYEGRAYTFGLTNGEECSSAVECSSLVCADGRCCDTECKGDCVSCLAVHRASGADGECGPVLARTNPRDACIQGTAPCGGTGWCDGGGSCEFPDSTVECGPASCSTTTSADPADTCDGAGGCTVRAAKSCPGGYLCAKGACETSCTGPEVCDGARGFACIRSACKVPLAGPCSARSDCESGYCSLQDGICCDAACDEECDACTRAKKGAGADGVCGHISADADPDEECASSAKVCGADGFCDGNGSCRAVAPSATNCGDTTCSAGLIDGSLCDGKGQCLASSSDCGLYPCRGRACAQSCESTLDCEAGAFCNEHSECQSARVNGADCGAAVECASGFCADGMCCNTACSGQCEACNLALGEGTCLAVTGSPSAGRAECDPGSADQPCRALACNGKERNACRAYVAGTFCSASYCQGIGEPVEGACDGAGECRCPSGDHCNENKTSLLGPHDEIIEECGAYLCLGDACPKECTKSSQCAGELACIDHQCQVVKALAGDSSGCSTASSRGASSILYALMLASFGAFRRRIRRKIPCVTA